MICYTVLYPVFFFLFQSYLHNPVKFVDVNFSPLSNSKKLLREVRYIRQEVSQDLAALFIFDGKIGIISTTKERYGLIIASRELTALLQVIWDFTWKQTAEAIS